MADPLGNNTARPRGGTVTEDDISQLLQFYLNFSSNIVKKPEQYKAIMRRVIELFQRDYDVCILNNKNGQLCDTYPHWMILPRSAINLNKQPHPRSQHHSATSPRASLEATLSTDTINTTTPTTSVSNKGSQTPNPNHTQQFHQQSNQSSNNDLLPENELRSTDIEKVFLECRFARVHGRFAFPVVFLSDDKFVCRSGTISRGAESMYRNISSRVKQTWEKWSFWGNNNGNGNGNGNGNSPSSANGNTTQTGTSSPSSSNTHTAMTAMAAQPSLQIAPSSLVVDALTCLTSSASDDALNNLVAPPNTGAAASASAAGKTPAQTAEGDIKATFSTSQQRQWDCELLRRLNVGHIVDIMVENKKVKYGLTLCTSEKATKTDSVYYTANNINIQAMPYPGREFFRFSEYPADKKYHLKWEDAGLADAVFSVSNIDLKKYFPGIDFAKEHRKWDMITITKHYLRLVIHMLADDARKPCGVLLHCLSGWDRTPLFISLLRISLWADNKVHQSLDLLEFLYLTLAYDWMLFCHQLKERLESNEEVMMYCFDFLQHITSDAYSYQRNQHNSTTDTAERESKWNTKSHTHPHSNHTHSHAHHHAHSASTSATTTTTATATSPSSANTHTVADISFDHPLATVPVVDSPKEEPSNGNNKTQQHNNNNSSYTHNEQTERENRLCGLRTAFAPHYKRLTESYKFEEITASL